MDQNCQGEGKTLLNNQGPKEKNKEKKESVSRRYELLKPYMNERMRRLWVAAEAIEFGDGGVRGVAEAVGISRDVITLGRRELRKEQTDDEREQLGPDRQRRPGGGRKSILEKNPEVMTAIETIVNPATRGDPERPLKWVSKSLKHIEEELQKQGFAVKKDTISRILRKTLEYGPQGLKKTKEGANHPDRDPQFNHINEQCAAFQKRGQPSISVDTKKKELVGDFKNGGQEWQPKGKPEEVRVHDFKDKELGKAAPYGIYDVAKNEGWVSVGIDHDTSEFAVNSIRQWWTHMGKSAYPEAKELLITADAGGSNGYRVRLWKRELQKLADEIGLEITVCHLPPGTSKWNKIEHRMFCHITQNWRGRPLLTLETIVNLIGNTSTAPGLTIKSALDRNTYPKGLKVSDDEIRALNIERNTFHGEWNYTIAPRGKTDFSENQHREQ